MDRLAVMEQFLAVAEAGSFSAAARRLNVGQPSISKAVAQLEAYLGVRLFQRSTRRRTRTEAGRRDRAGAERAIAAAAAAEIAAKEDGGRLAGPVRVVVPTCLARLHLVPRLREFSDRFPEVTLDLEITDRETDVVASGVDIALRIGTLADTALVASRMARTRMALVANKAENGLDAPHNFMGQPAIISRLHHAKNSWVFRDGSARIAIMVHPALILDSDDAARSAALAGLGYAMLPRPFVADLIDTGDLVELLPNHMLEDIDLWALLPAGRDQTARVRAFLDWLRPQMNAIFADEQPGLHA